MFYITLSSLADFYYLILEFILIFIFPIFSLKGSSLSSSTKWAGISFYTYLDNELFPAREQVPTMVVKKSLHIFKTFSLKIVIFLEDVLIA